MQALLLAVAPHAARGGEVQQGQAPARLQHAAERGHLAAAVADEFGIGREQRLDLREVPALHGLREALQQRGMGRSEEHTSELQSPCNLVCRLLLEKKKNISKFTPPSIIRMHRCRPLDPCSSGWCFCTSECYLQCTTSHARVEASALLVGVSTSQQC